MCACYHFLIQLGVGVYSAIGRVSSAWNCKLQKQIPINPSHQECEGEKKYRYIYISKLWLNCAVLQLWATNCKHSELWPESERHSNSSNEFQEHFELKNDKISNRAAAVYRATSVWGLMNRTVWSLMTGTEHWTEIPVYSHVLMFYWVK